MEFQKIVNLFDTTFDEQDLPRFVTKKWIEVYDQSEKNCNLNKEVRIKTPMLRLDLCDFRDAYIFVKRVIAVTNPDDAKRNKAVALKNNVPLINWISKINGVQIDNAKYLDIVMVMYNLNVNITEKQHAACGIMTEMNQVLLFLLILNCSK